MTTNYSNVVKIFESPVTVVVSQPNNFQILVDYGDGIEQPVAIMPSSEIQRTSSANITVTNSTVEPNVAWQYYDESLASWVNLDSGDPFTISSTAQSPTNPWEYNIVAAENIDLEIWGDREFRFHLVSDFVDGDKIVLTTNNSLPFQFEMDYGSPPVPTRTVQPTNTYVSSGTGSFTTEYRVYGSDSGMTASWQYSDDYDEANPELATWSTISNGGNFQVSAGSSSTTLNIGYGIIGSPPTFSTKSSGLVVSSPVYTRVYRHTFTFT
jgi:hypothetical protein